MEEYEEQLKQINEALDNCTNDDDRANLQSLKNDIMELINLSFLESLEDEKLEVDQETIKLNLQKQFEHLMNKKVRAPFNINDQESMQNAFIADIEENLEEYNDVVVKVFFLNPLIEKMNPCDHYFSGSCTYNSDCKYSHGELVLNSKLLPYQEPNYESLKRKSHIYVKAGTDVLWKPATVLSCSRDSRICQVKLQNGNVVDVNFDQILPPIDDGNSDDDSDSSSDFDDASYHDQPAVKFLVSENAFGEWEKFTRGFGSKMLKKFGYQEGEGLGVRGGGIVEPIEAKIYIQGKSLDYNMEKKEQREKQAAEEKTKRENQRRSKESSESKKDIFAFINEMNKINQKASKSNQSKSDLKSHSKQELNLNTFKIDEDIKKLEKCISKLNESRKRQLNDPKALANIEAQINVQRTEIDNLRKKLRSIDKEQEARKSKKHLTVF